MGLSDALDEGGSGIYNLKPSGTLTATKLIIQYGTFNQYSGTNKINTLSLGHISDPPSYLGIYNLCGGTLILNSMINVINNNKYNSSEFNFGGGTIQAGKLSFFSTTMPMNIDIGGTGVNANVDTAGFLLTFSGALTGWGGMNKLGAGTLTLDAVNQYIGPTTITAGTLALTCAGTIDVSSRITVQSGAFFDVSAKNSGGGFSLGSTQTLTGGGTVNGKVIAVSGSHIAVTGDGVGVISFTSNLTLNGSRATARFRSGFLRQ